MQIVRTVAEQLFVHRKPNSYFSEFITKYEEEFGVSDTNDLMAEIANSFEDLPHFRAHYARYLMFRVDNGDQAIDEIKHALLSLGVPIPFCCQCTAI